MTADVKLLAERICNELGLEPDELVRLKTAADTSATEFAEAVKKAAEE